MRPFSLKLFLLAICIVLAFRSNAQTNTQTCTGSLGDPVINQDFGSGLNPGGPLAPGMTNMTYTTNNCPNDGEYTIANSLVGSGNCHPGIWHDVPTDHTGNPNGYMMIVNASYTPSIFFTDATTGGALCPSTTYEFSAYVLNLYLLEAAGPNVTEPNIVFTIESPSGQVISSDTIGNIPNTSQGILDWKKCGVFFTTPPNVTDVVVKMTNLAPGGIGNDLILDDITFRACGPVIQAGFASTTGPVSQQLCEGGSANYTLKAQVLGVNTPSYQWQSNMNGAGWTDMPGKAADTLDIGFSNAAAGLYQYRLGTANGASTAASCRVYSPPMAVTVNPLPAMPPFAPQTICEGSPLTLTASGGANYIWSGPNLAPTMQNPLFVNSVTPANAGTYSVVAISPQGCSAPAVQAVVKVTPKVTAIINTNPLPICAGESIPLSASGGLIYKWTPSTGLNRDDVPDPVATPSKTTTYTVYVSNDAVCNGDSKSVTVTVNQLPVADAGSDKKIFEGQSVKLDGSVKGDQLVSVYWTPITDLSDPTSPTTIASPTDNTTYTLHAISESCGISTSSVYIRVYKKITIPNAFSPNNDGINDIWNINQLITYPESLIMVYNRYGQQVYQSTGYAKPWDGTVNGAPLPGGTYYYVIDLKNSTPKIAGWVLIIK